VAVRLAAAEAGGRMQVGLLDPGFVALPGDPAAGAAISLAGSAEELRALLRTQIEDHMRPMIELLSAHTRLGRRAQWSLVADACAELCLRIGQHLGQQERACAEGLAVIKAADSPMRPSKTAYLTLAEGERCATFRLRGSCCMYYKTPAGANCATCPLLSGEEREARLRATLQPSA
jgi:ferric iron reductase protein FhuF